MTFTAANFQRAVLNWFSQHGRKNLPWQQTITPYRVWVSEIMLQQTQVATVIPYYNRFMTHFPEVNSLANAAEDEVLHLWTGLGYYARARNLLKTARIIQEKYAGNFPPDLIQLQELPGIGRSTAAAILALSMQQRAAILDGNVKRVLARVHALTAWQNIDKLWVLAEKYTPKSSIPAYTQAMMDLGAMLCTRTKPACLICPLQKYCVAFKRGQQELFPGKKPSKKLPVRTTQLLLLCNAKGEVLLEKRPNKGIWGGLWSLPECLETEDVAELCLSKYCCTIKNIKKHTSFRHTFTHFHLDITPIEAQANINAHQLKSSSEYQWYDVKNPTRLGLAATIKQLLFSRR